ncbi:hypothetical protein HDV00_002402 [Rhizophlyctis rosea]|nr:hypothetical protein HDV00_002402 [Rhizophlyctis rosea]
MEGQQVDVSINGNTTSLAATTPGLAYYTGVVNVNTPGDVTYQYVVDGKAESFTRTLPAASTATYNDLYGRSISYKPLPPFPNPFPDKPQWNRSTPTDRLFDTGYVPILAITANADQIAQLNQMTIPYINASMTIFYANDMATFQNIIFAIHKIQPSYNAKRAMDLGLTGNDNINGRKYFKMRDLSTEPTQMREVIYTNMLHACGVISPNQVHVRMYVNGVPYGLFAMTDYTLMKAGISWSTRENFPATAFFNGAPPTPITSWFEGWSNFDYLGDSISAYKAFDSSNPLSLTVKDLIPALKILSQINGTQAGADSFAMVFAIDQIFLSMAFEYLAEDWDAYWANSRNYALYFDPVSQKWFYIPQDFDYTFSQFSRGDTPESTYQVWEQGHARPTLPRVPPVTTPLINNLLAVPAYRQRFEASLIAIVKTLYNPVVFNAHVLAHADRLSEEVAWDLSNPRPMVGQPDHYTYTQFLQAINGTGPVGGAQYSLTQYVAARAVTVAKQFNFQWTQVAPVAPPVPALTVNGTVMPLPNTTPSPPPDAGTGTTGTQPLYDQPVRKATSGAACHILTLKSQNMDTVVALLGVALLGLTGATFQRAGTTTNTSTNSPTPHAPPPPSTLPPHIDPAVVDQMIAMGMPREDIVAGLNCDGDAEDRIALIYSILGEKKRLQTENTRLDSENTRLETNAQKHTESLRRLGTINFERGAEASSIIHTVAFTPRVRVIDVSFTLVNDEAELSLTGNLWGYVGFDCSGTLGTISWYSNGLEGLDMDSDSFRTMHCARCLDWVVGLNPKLREHLLSSWAWLTFEERDAIDDMVKDKKRKRSTAEVGSAGVHAWRSKRLGRCAGLNVLSHNLDDPKRRILNVDHRHLSPFQPAKNLSEKEKRVLITKGLLNRQPLVIGPDFQLPVIAYTDGAHGGFVCYFPFEESWTRVGRSKPNASGKECVNSGELDGLSVHYHEVVPSTRPYIFVSDSITALDAFYHVWDSRKRFHWVTAERQHLLEKWFDTHPDARITLYYVSAHEDGDRKSTANEIADMILWLYTRGEMKVLEIDDGGGGGVTFKKVRELGGGVGHDPGGPSGYNGT